LENERARRNRPAFARLIHEPDFGGDMGTTDKSMLEKIAARIKDIIRIAEDAARHATKAERPPRTNKRVSDFMES
jgi:hypothetical protein